MSELDHYPKSITLADGANVEIRLMSEADRDPVLSFANALTQEDLLFLRVDITQPQVVDEWINNLKTGHSTSLVAYDDEGLIGYATVHRNPAPWTRRAGELRVNVSQAYRAGYVALKIRTVDTQSAGNEQIAARLIRAPGATNHSAQFREHLPQWVRHAKLTQV